MSTAPEPITIGITGGVAAGKSTVAGLLAELGCVVYNADEEVSRVLADPDVNRQIALRWGPTVLTEQGTVDRRALARLVFADEPSRKELEMIVHPRLGEAQRRAQQEAKRRGAPAVVYDAPLLVEVGLDRECDAVIFVDAPIANRQQRALRERGWSEKEILERESAQCSLVKKRQASQYVVVNDGDIESLRTQTRSAFERISASRI